MIEFSHIHKVYDSSFRALWDISLTIENGEFVFLTGQSGAGKTTLLKHIIMEEFPSDGMLSVFGRVSSTRHHPKFSEIAKLRREMGIVFQDIRLLSDRTVFDNVCFAARVGGGTERQIKRRVFEALTVVGLSHKNTNKPNQLSGGEHQRIAIARAIVNEPRLLVADEPTGNLDRAISDEIFSLIEQINSWGTTVIMATHDRSFLERTHYREISLDHGQLIRGGGSRIITGNYKKS